MASVKTPSPRPQATVMLSRVAHSLYWMSRYIERAENLARILDVASRMATLPSAYAGSSNEWESAVETSDCAHGFQDLRKATPRARRGLTHAGSTR